MLHSYPDILKRIAEPPLWYDANGTPRFDTFHPTLRPDIYASEVALLEAVCQSCPETFQVQIHWSHLDAPADRLPIPTLSERLILLRGGTLMLPYVSYGDPPPHGCAGDTMGSITLRVLQFWTQREEATWKRVEKLEIPINL